MLHNNSLLAQIFLYLPTKNLSEFQNIVLESFSLSFVVILFDSVDLIKTVRSLIFSSR